MKADKKLELRERRIESLNKQIEKLKAENEALRASKQELLDKLAIYQCQFADIEILIDEYKTSIAAANVIKGRYEQAADAARKMKKVYENQFKQLMKQFKCKT